VAILHYFGDFITNAAAPNSGFANNCVYPIASPPEDSAPRKVEEGANVEDERDQGEETVENKDSTLMQDELALHALILALKYIIKDRQLPMLASTFWSIVQRCVPPFLWSTLVHFTIPFIQLRPGPEGSPD
jgi:hypothetical protein